MAKKPAPTAPSSTAEAAAPRGVAPAPVLGYVGTAVDPTPRQNYAVAGVIVGAPTPETDPDAATAARAADRDRRDHRPAAPE